MAPTIILSSVFALLVALVVWLWLSRRLLRPLAEIVEGTERMARGDYSTRLEQPVSPSLVPLVAAQNRLGARVEQQLDQLTAERNQLTEILSSMSEGVLVVDPEGRITSTNPAFRQLFDPRDDCVGRHTLDAVRQPGLSDLIDSTLASHQGQTAQLEITSPEPATISLRSSPLTDRAGVVVVARDIADLVRFSEIRRDLVANVSHELKTPLTAIRGYAETLRDGAIDDPSVSHGFLDRILAQGLRLEALLTDLLTLSRLERRVDIERTGIVDVGKLVEQAVETLDVRAREHNISISWDGRSHPVVNGDPEILGSLVVNLIDNAVKYNRDGGSVDIRLSQEARTIRLEVQDSGIGIPADAIDRVFERFYRVDKGRSRAEGGTGLGLTIVKHSANLHGGSVAVESRVGRGSTFTVTLPAAPELNPARAPSATPAGPARRNS